MSNTRKPKRDREVPLSDLFLPPLQGQRDDGVVSHEVPQSESRIVFSLFVHNIPVDDTGDVRSAAVTIVQTLFERFNITPLGIQVVRSTDKLFIKVAATLTSRDVSSSRFRRLSESIVPLASSIRIDTDYDNKIQRREAVAQARRQLLLETVAKLVAEGMDPVQAAQAAHALVDRK